MNYKHHYDRLIETRRQFNRSKNNDGLLETHHILPKSIGGTNSKDNLVLLTPREHFIAHWLLLKIYTGQNKAKMAYAFFRMCSNNKNQKRVVTSTQYNIAKKAMSDLCNKENNPNYGKKLWNEEQRNAIKIRQLGENNSMYGKTPWNKGMKGVIYHTEETKKKIKDSYVYRVTEQSKKKISDALKNKRKSDEHREKLRSANIGKPRSIESITKTANALRGKSHNVVICPHCGKHGGYVAMIRWHFNNCKNKK